MIVPGWMGHVNIPKIERLFYELLEDQSDTIKRERTNNATMLTLSTTRMVDKIGSLSMY